jgi:hypothetical protein
MNTLAIFVNDYFSLNSQASEGVTYALIAAMTLIALVAICVAAWLNRRQ